MVYLSNFNQFYIEKDNFANKEYEDFYIYNSCAYPIIIKEVGKNTDLILPHASNFLKIFKNQQGFFEGKNIATNTELVASLITTLDENLLNKKFKNGTIVKLTKENKTIVYKYNKDGNYKPVPLTDCSLNLRHLKNYASNEKLFIFKSSNNESNLNFDFSELALENEIELGEDGFYVHNATSSTLKISIGDSKRYSLLPPLRTVEISQYGFSYMETHSKGLFYINNKIINKNYLSKSKINVLIDALPNHNHEEGGFLDKIKSAAYLKSEVNIAISFLEDKGASPDIYAYGFPKTENDSFSLNSIFNNGFSKKFYLFTNNKQLIEAQNLTYKPEESPFEIKNLSIEIASVGHYIINGNDSDIVVSPSVLENIFLINNCVKDVVVYLEKENNNELSKLILFRNTVLVINNGQPRYLKKAKQRDEFYCVFNPKTMTSLPNEVVASKAMGRTQDISQIFPTSDTEDATAFPKPSYIKLLSKSNTSTVTRLSIRDYYNGIDIPTDSPENVLAYEVGIGHEVIYKFLFFDPSESTYTLPGIENNTTYVVKADSTLFYNLTNLEGNFEPIEEKPYVKYDGKLYLDGEEFVGTSVGNYEIKYPYYVKVAKIIKNLEKTFEISEGELVDEIISPEAIISEMSEDELNEVKKSNFKELILNNFKNTLSDIKCWIPNEEYAFWQDSSSRKDIYTISEINPMDTKTITDGTQYVSFVKCIVKKDNLQKITNQFLVNLYSAPEFKYAVTKPDSLLIGMGKGWSDDDYKKAVKTANDLYTNFNYSNYLKPIAETTHEVCPLSRNLNLFVSLEKLKSMPTIKFENFSNSSIIKLLNGGRG